MGLAFGRASTRPVKGHHLPVMGKERRWNSVISGNLSQFLSRLEEVAEELNQESDTLSQIIATVEERLAASNIGVTVWLASSPLSQWSGSDHQTGDDIDSVVELGYTKFGKDWRLALRTEVSKDEGETWKTYSVNALQNASRDLRIKALEELPQLLERLTEEASASVKTIRSAKATLA